MPETIPQTAEAPHAGPMRPLCISMKQTGDLLNVSTRQVYTLAASAGLPTIRLGGRRLVRLPDLERWVAAQPLADAGQDREIQQTQGDGAGAPQE